MGAREHYAIPRALHSVGYLRGLVTEFWADPAGLLPRISARFRGRFHPDLRDAKVHSGGVTWAAVETYLRTRRALRDSSDWPLLVSRNASFDNMARRHLERIALARSPESPDAVFAYSYACTTTLTAAADRGLHAVMGQIDGGPVEESIVLEEMARYPQLKERYRPAPDAYWKEWRAQCAAAARIVVNSPWAEHCLRAAGIAPDKLVTVPLYYETAIAIGPRQARQALPHRFDTTRPLRVLFLGQLNLRKGAGRLFDAIRMLKGKPVEFVVVGPASVTIPDDIMALRSFRYEGPADRSRVHDYYAAADVFILPTLSDGFALTQLEAQAHGLPIIASTRCGPVVTHGKNGLLLPEVTPEAIADSIYRLLSDPDMLSGMRENARAATGDLPQYSRLFIERTCA